MFLDEIVGHKRAELLQKKKEKPLDSFKSTFRPSDRSFRAAIEGRGKKKISIIAEIKKASPSEGMLRKDLDVKKIASVYCKYAKAISIVTDEKYFQGSGAFVSEARSACSLSILRKDFIIDEYQVYESRLLGADAILLIAAILKREEITKFISVARSLEMDCLVEVHSKSELEKALAAGAEIVGINNRNLSTFKTSLSVSEKLIPKIPAGKVIVVESGLHSREDLLKFQGKADAALIGSALMKARDIEAKLRELAE